jgi:monovalent cation/hydrogen antiporter
MPIDHHIFLVLALLFAMLLLYMLSQKLNVSYPIFLVIGGLLIGFLPGVPRIALQPDIVFLLFLPPLLYEAAWFTAWHNFWRWRRSIASLALGLVILTSLAVAMVSNALIPDFTLALGFLLGGIISPPDAAAATSVLRGAEIPKRLATILEGESLVNDASSLIIFRFALAAVLTGHFVLQRAITDFFLVATLGILTGLAVAILFYCFHRFLPTTPSVDVILTIMAPYLMYLTAEQLHVSGVLAVVSGGLFMSSRSHKLFNYDSRIQANSIWNSLIFLLNGLVFILIGLQLPLIVEGLGQYSVREAIFYALVISAVTIVIRLLYVLPNALLPHLVNSKVRRMERRPPLKVVFLAGWAGMRGVVSLASALAIPLTLKNGQAFPNRNLILFITFVVILVTLVFQGLSMPLLVRWLKVKELDEHTPEEQQLAEIHLRMAKLSLKHLSSRYANEVASDAELNRLYGDLQLLVGNAQVSPSDDTQAKKLVEMKKRLSSIFLDLTRQRRNELERIRRENLYDSEVLLEYEYQLDLEEARMRI